jgi:uncharacterized membrane protein YfcA
MSALFAPAAPYIGTMEGMLIVLVALVASLLTLFSGFGLGTLLLPAFILFFPAELAVGLTAVVHLLNNLFKFGLLWRAADRAVVLRFGLAGMAGAWLGASLLMRLDDLPYLYPGVRVPVSATHAVLGLLMAAFALVELLPGARRWALTPRWLVPGGALSGFFGGLSGHQGALRSIFLLRTGLGKEAFIATGTTIAVLVDLTRIPVYWSRMPDGLPMEHGGLLLATVASAFLGSWWGRRLIPKVTFRAVQLLVGVLLLAIALALLAGVF